MSERMNKARLLDLTRSERKLLEKVLASIPEETLTTPGVSGDWSVKDLLAHIVAWERRMVRSLEETLRGEVPQQLPPGMTWDDLDQLNEQTYRENQDRPLADVRAEFAHSYAEALRAVEQTPEEALIDPQRFAWRKGKPLWEMVAANMHQHYEEHRTEIRDWLARTDREP